jgi:hypothetical protein
MISEVPEQAVSPETLLQGAPNSVSFNDELWIVKNKLRQKPEIMVKNRQIDRENRYKTLG